MRGAKSVKDTGNDASMTTAMAKHIPSQPRARATYEKLLAAAGELVAEVGIERISTNLIAERAGLTPPTFYHYFHDKYDVLGTLGKRLMDAQNALVPIDADQNAEGIAAMLIAHVDVTRGFPGGHWVMRILRAVPALEHIRIDSHREMARVLTEAELAANPGADHATLFAKMRLVVEIGYGAIEMAFEEPDLDVEDLMRDAARAILAVVPRQP